MPRRSIWKGSFVDAFLLRMKKKISLLLNRKIGSRRSSILPEFVDCSVRIYNALRCKITEEKVGHKESLLLHGNEDFREQGEKVKKKRIWHEKEIRFR